VIPAVIPCANACEARCLSVGYRDALVLKDVDFDVPSGVIMAIVGPNGAGKSTLMKGMLGLVPPAAGSVSFFGRPFAQVRTRVGYIPQHSAVDWDFPATVFDVVLMGTYGALGWFRRPGPRERARSWAALERASLTHLADRQIGELSGGERQRAFLARALAQDADLYFLDEPLQGVDALSKHAILDVMRDLRTRGKTLVMVHHDPSTVRALCDWVALVNKGIVASGPVESTFSEDNVRRAYAHVPTAAWFATTAASA
jgi:manganese/zinc/iron transport system ATP- binding protein